MTSKYTPDNYRVKTDVIKNKMFQNNSIITLIDALSIIEEQVIYEGSWKKQ